MGELGELMVGELVVGETRIAYDVRRSPVAKRRRLIVRPDRVEVVVPTGQTDGEVADFVRRRREWIFTEQEKLREREARQRSVGPGQMISGAKIPYRGRMMRLRVERWADGGGDGDGNGNGDGDAGSGVSVEYRNGFRVTAPGRADDGEIRAAVEAWLMDRVKRDVRGFVGRHSPTLGVTPKAVRVMDLSKVWGSCGAGGIIHLNWKLIFAPMPVLEYAVAHELSHLRHRDHTPAFWRTVGELVDGYELRRDWLAANEDLLAKAWA